MLALRCGNVRRLRFASKGRSLRHSSNAPESLTLWGRSVICQRRDYPIGCRFPVRSRHWPQRGGGMRDFARVSFCVGRHRRRGCACLDLPALECADAAIRDNRPGPGCGHRGRFGLSGKALSLQVFSCAENPEWKACKIPNAKHIIYRMESL